MGQKLIQNCWLCDDQRSAGHTERVGNRLTNIIHLTNALHKGNKRMKSWTLKMKTLNWSREKVDQLLKSDVGKNLKLVEKRIKTEPKNAEAIWISNWNQSRLAVYTAAQCVRTLQRASHSREFFSKTVDKFKSYCWENFLNVCREKCALLLCGVCSTQERTHTQTRLCGKSMCSITQLCARSKFSANNQLAVN